MSNNTLHTFNLTMKILLVAKQFEYHMHVGCMMKTILQLMLTNTRTHANINVILYLILINK